MRINLVKLNLMRRDGFPIAIENQESGAGCPLIDRPKEHLRGLHDLIQIGSAATRSNRSDGLLRTEGKATRYEETEGIKQQQKRTTSRSLSYTVTKGIKQKDGLTLHLNSTS